jgi:hypothetical protein
MKSETYHSGPLLGSRSRSTVVDHGTLGAGRSSGSSGLQDGNVSTLTDDGWWSEAYLAGGGDDGSARLLRGRFTGLDEFLFFFFFIISGTLGTAGSAVLEGGAVADLGLGLLMSANCYRERCKFVRRLMDPTIDFFSAWSLMAMLLTIDDMVVEIEARRKK